MSGRILTVASVVLLALLAIGEGFVREYSGDFHWHTVLGEQTLREHRVADTDSFSHTYVGRPMRNTAWLGDVALALGFRGGYAGAYVVRALALLALVALVLREGKRAGLGAPAAALLAALPLLHEPLQRFLRPELFAFVCLAALLHLLGEHERRPRRAPLVLAVVTILLWANLHGSVSIGLFVVGCYALARGLRRLQRPRDLRGALAWAGLPAAGLAAACASPLGLSGPLAIEILRPAWIAISPDWMPLEAWPPWLLALTALGCVLLLAAGRRVSWWRLAVLVVLAFLAARYRRFVVPALIAAAPLLAATLATVRAKLAERGLGRGARRAGGLVAALAAAWGSWLVLVDARLLDEVGLTSDPGAYPEAACAWARGQPLDGQLFNSGPIGSYLMWCLPDHPVYVDQRAWSLYDEPFFVEYLATSNDPDRLEALVRPHDLGWAFTGYDTIAEALSRRPDLWRLVYFDDVAQIYVRRDRPGNARLAGEGFVRLHPASLAGVPWLRGPALGEAEVELARLVPRCPRCTRTLLAVAAVAVAAGDEAAYAAALDQLLDRGESPEVAYLAGSHAQARGRWEEAAVFYERFRALGGDPLASRVLEARARHRAGDATGAATLLGEAARLPGGAAVVEQVRRELGSER